MIVRMRALPSGTVGKAMPVPSTPSLKSSFEKSIVRRPSPIIMGVIGVSLAGVVFPPMLKPRSPALSSSSACSPTASQCVRAPAPGRQTLRYTWPPLKVDAMSKTEMAARGGTENRSGHACRKHILPAPRWPSKACPPEYRLARASQNGRLSRARCAPARLRNARRRPS